MRASGILLPVFSLPGKYGIGCFSEEAYRFVDFLKAAGQSFWQILPVGPTGYGDSPYQSFSAFAGNPYFLSPEALRRDGLLTEEEAEQAIYPEVDSTVDSSVNSSVDSSVNSSVDPSGHSEKKARCAGNAKGVDYAWLYRERIPLLRKAYVRWKQKGGGLSSAAGETAEGAAFERFQEENASWLMDYALFMALKEAHGGGSFHSWEEPVRLRREDALAAARRSLAEETGFYIFLQYQFEKQWRELKDYANRAGISIIGDIPIYVPADSADVWSHPELFQLNRDGTCRAVAGCPPDGFSATGQLWGNPLYDWPTHTESGYTWWIRRMRRCRELFDIVRIDHFRGFDQYYAIPADSPDARSGRWEDGPGIGLFREMEKELPGLRIIAEDLGYITDSVRELVRKTGYPNMKVLEFAFDSRDSSGKDLYLPYNYDKNCVVYTGTHDNETLVGWLDSILPQERAGVRAFLGLEEEAGGLDEERETKTSAADKGTGNPAADKGAGSSDTKKGTGNPDAGKGAGSSVADKGAGSSDVKKETERLAQGMVRTAMASVADLCVIPMQDWLLLGAQARINTPSTAAGNWCWRMEESAASPALADRIRKMTEIYGRERTH